MIIISYASVLHANAPVEQLSTIAPVHKVLLNLRLMLSFFSPNILFNACFTQAQSSLCKLHSIYVLRFDLLFTLIDIFCKPSMQQNIN